MNKYISLLLLLQLMFVSAAAQEKSANVAYQDNTVRFTVITDGVIRMEWSPDGKFTDQSTFVAVNRSYPQVNCKVKSSGSWVEIATTKMNLKYKKNSGKFAAGNLSVTSVKGMLPFAWKPGDQQKNNLKGTYRTLDDYDGNIYSAPEYLKPGEDPALPIEDGLLATDGWTLIDDSKNFLFDKSEWPWVETRPEQDVQDWYFMAYGHDYKAALKDFTVFAGKVPLPPRYAFGYWWSRYWSYSENEFRELVNKFQTYEIPLDVLVIDMDWHYTEPGKGGWTGYTWNRRLFPDPEKFLGFLKKNELEVTLNLHPADGVAPFEQHYPEMAKWMGVNPASQDTIAFLASDKKFMSGWYNTILRPLEKAGVDFWWLDWQQWLNDKKVKGLSNTWWLNYATFSDMERTRDTRPMLYHRWGGLGNHRYQIGFSGDAIISWKSLDYQPYFNSTASNVLYGYWSHDLGGHTFVDWTSDQKIEPEMFVRWMQFGAVSPIMRTHSTKNGNLNKEPWVFSSEYFTILRNVILQRYQMAPYIYTMARKAYDDAISLCRPMYYDYPENQEAYGFKNEYMFGDNIMVAPITAPMENGYSTLKVWLPEGNNWYEWQTGTLLKGGQTIERSFALDEYPLYVKAGAIIPMLGKVKNLRRNDEPVTLAVFPEWRGAKSTSTFDLYEDNGNDKDYAGHYAVTPVTSECAGNELMVTIGGRKGNYRDMPANRSFCLKVVGSGIPQKITVNGEAVSYRYDGTELSLLVDVAVVDCSVEKVVKITYPEDVPELNDGLSGKIRRMQKSISQLKYRKAGIVLSEELGTMESMNREISYYPERFNESIQAFRQHYGNLPEILKKQDISDEIQHWFLQSVNYEH